MDNRETLISVIIPVYNGEKYLEACVESIKKQTYQNVEIIIINDGSTDKTGEICIKLQSVYDKIRIIALQDEGVSAARNAGIEAAAGDLITFVDADDRLRPAMLQILYDCIRTTESDVAGCGFFMWETEEDWEKVVRVTAESTETAEKFLPESVRVYTPRSYMEEAVLQGNSRCWSKVYRREAIKKVRFRKGLSIGEDMLFLLDMLSSVGKIAEIPYQGYGYFKNPGGAISRKFTPKYMDQIRCWELARDIVAGKDAENKLYEQATTILMMSIMLTAGKLAMLSAAERRTQKNYIRICHEKLKDAMCIKGAYRKLSKGYKIKTTLFRYLPNLYLNLYHLRKAGGNR